MTSLTRKTKAPITYWAEKSTLQECKECSLYTKNVMKYIKIVPKI